MPPPSQILLVDDDPHLREAVGFALTQAGFAVREASNGREALDAFAKSTPDLVVLDVMMPELDGLEVCRALRRSSRVPILFLSSRDEELDRILGLELGGDDYLGKPFSVRELVARVKALHRRLAPQTEPVVRDAAPRILARGPLRIDLTEWRSSWAGTPVTLTVTELNLLATMLRAPTKAFTRDELIDGMHGGDCVVSDRTVDSHIRRIRQKFAALGAEVIETVHGHGYRLAVDG